MMFILKMKVIFNFSKDANAKITHHDTDFIDVAIEPDFAAG